MRTEKRKTILITVAVGILITAAAGYIGLSLYYSRGYSLGTYINGVYCTGKTPEEVNELLTEQYVHGELAVRVSETKTEFLNLSAVERQADFTQQLRQILARQNPFLWVGNLFWFGHYTIEPDVIYDEASLLAHISELECMAADDGIQMPHEVVIHMTDHGYQLDDNTKRIFDRESALQAITDAVEHGRSSVDLMEKNCYYDLEVTPQMEELYALWEKIDEFQSFSMKYRFGDSEELVDASVTSKWITLDEGMNFVMDAEGRLVLDESAVAAYIAGLAEKYDTYGAAREYLTHDGKTVTVEGSIYGNEIDQEAECAYLTEAFLTRNTADREPEYRHRALYQGSDDIGPTYIEVNLTEQKLYYIKDREVFLETDIVSGNIRSGHRTPSRICYIQGMYRNTVLRGPGYASFVSYWIPVYKAIGIHDATWRSRFGGDIYLTNGSHGCVNVPLEQMEILYADVEKGMPVILFYEDAGTQ